MSVRSRMLRCRGCAFEAALQPRSITLRYRLPDGSEVDGYRSFGWCHACDTVTDIEDALDIEELRQAVAASEPKSGVFARFLGKSSKAKNGAEAEEYQRLQGLLTLARLRRSPSRCLRCGSSDTVLLRMQEGGSVAGFTHSCGSALYQVPIDPDAPGLSFQPEVISLDVEGNRLDRRSASDAFRSAAASNLAAHNSRARPSISDSLIAAIHTLEPHLSNLVQAKRPTHSAAAIRLASIVGLTTAAIAILHISAPGEDTAKDEIDALLGHLSTCAGDRTVRIDQVLIDPALAAKASAHLRGTTSLNEKGALALAYNLAGKEDVPRMLSLNKGPLGALGGVAAVLSQRLVGQERAAELMMPVVELVTALAHAARPAR